MANINTSILEDESKLQEAFNFFDEDKSGSISVEELKKVFGDNEDFKTVQKLLCETDLNNDGEVYINRFHSKNSKL